MYKLLLLSVISIALLGCDALQKPEVKDIRNIDVLKVTQDEMELTADLIVHNSNPIGLDLASAQLQILIDDIELGTMQQNLDVKMPPNADFSLPIQLKLDLTRLYKGDLLGAIGKGLQMFSKRSIRLRFLGDIKAGKAKVKFKVPVDQTKEIKF